MAWIRNTVSDVDLKLVTRKNTIVVMKEEAKVIIEKSNNEEGSKVFKELDLYTPFPQ